MTDFVDRNSHIYSVLADDPDLCELVRIFVEEMPARVEKLLDEFQSKDWDALQRTTHQLRGAVGSYGFRGISPSAGKLESAIEENASEETIHQQLNELIALCHRMSPEPSDQCESAEERKNQQ
jgi:FOG: HPt domain